VQRIGIRSPTVLYDTLARHVGAFYCIRKPSICQVKAFDGHTPLAGGAGVAAHPLPRAAQATATPHTNGHPMHKRSYLLPHWNEADGVTRLDKRG
jgi:hypothetical protein